VHTLFGGIDIKTSPSWKIESSVKAFAGGVDAPTPAQDEPDAHVLALDGIALLGGIAVGPKVEAAAAES
jgi:hypothetical protein